MKKYKLGSGWLTNPHFQYVGFIAAVIFNDGANRSIQRQSSTDERSQFKDMLLVIYGFYWLNVVGCFMPSGKYVIKYVIHIQEREQIKQTHRNIATLSGKIWRVL